jgi:hypothetical protein
LPLYSGTLENLTAISKIQKYNNGYSKTMDSYTACSIVEGFDKEEHTKAQQIKAWQYLVNTGVCWHLQGWYGRTATALIEAGVVKAKKR